MSTSDREHFSGDMSSEERAGELSGMLLCSIKRGDRLIKCLSRRQSFHLKCLANII